MSAPTVQFGTGTTVKDYAWYREWLRVGEGAGFDLLSTGDSQSLWADPFVSMTVAAMETTRPRIGVTVSNPMTRHPAVVASALSAIQQLADGRAIYGLSSGDSALRNIGVRPATVAELDEFGRAVKGLCDGDTVDYQGTSLVQRWEARHVPLWMAAEGPRTQRLAGQIADGVVLSNALTRDTYELACDTVRAGAEEAGRSMDDIEVWCMAAVCLADTEADGIHQLRFQLAGTANHVYRFHMDGKALPEELKPKIEELQRHYDSRHHASRETADHNAALVERLGLIDFLAARSVLAGPPERVVERIHEVVEAGPRNLLMSQFVVDQLGFMRTFEEKILPAFR